mmetsp:Transcript_26375/g.23304  ORF Transcript_26375/g.23304 Transcript_26375/m.23304 type:complete len:218 (-) Transcript_26375:88-741(-)
MDIPLFLINYDNPISINSNSNISFIINNCVMYYKLDEEFYQIKCSKIGFKTHEPVYPTKYFKIVNKNHERKDEEKRNLVRINESEFSIRTLQNPTIEKISPTCIDFSILTSSDLVSNRCLYLKNKDLDIDFIDNKYLRLFELNMLNIKQITGLKINLDISIAEEETINTNDIKGYLDFFSRVRSYNNTLCLNKGIAYHQWGNLPDSLQDVYAKLKNY